MGSRLRRGRRQGPDRALGRRVLELTRRVPAAWPGASHPRPAAGPMADSGEVTVPNRRYAQYFQSSCYTRLAEARQNRGQVARGQPNQGGEDDVAAMRVPAGDQLVLPPAVSSVVAARGDAAGQAGGMGPLGP